MVYIFYQHRKIPQYVIITTNELATDRTFPPIRANITEQVKMGSQDDFVKTSRKTSEYQSTSVCRLHDYDTVDSCPSW